MDFDALYDKTTIAHFADEKFRTLAVSIVSLTEQASMALFS